MKSIELVIYSKCNTPCRFCVSGQGFIGGMTVEDARVYMRERREAGASRIILGGGEPTIHPEFISIIKAAKDAEFSSVEIKTNGIRFCYPEFAKACVSAGADSYSVSVWGHNPAAHDWMAGRAGAYEMTEMGVKHLLHYGAEVKIDYLLSAVSIGKGAEAIEGFSRAGVKRFDMWLYSIFGAGGEGRDMVPSMTDAGAAAVSADETVAGYGGRVMTTHIPPCMLRGRPEMYYNVYSLELMIVMPDGRCFRAEDSPFEAGRHVKICAECGLRTACAGPRIEYIEEFGEEEFNRAADDGAWSPENNEE